MYTQRLVLLALSFGLAFGILFLYFNNIFAIALDVALFASILFAAKKEDLRQSGRTGIFILLVVLSAIFTVTASISIYNFVGSYLLVSLIVVDFLVLVAYIAATKSNPLQSRN